MKLRRLSMYLITAAIAAALVWLVFIFVPSSSVETVPVVLPTPAVSDSSADESNNQSGNDTVINISPGTVQAAISTLSRADNYSRVLNITNYWSGGNSQQQINVWVQGDSSRFTISGQGISKNVLINGTDLWIWYSDSKDIYHGSAHSGDADEYQALISYEHLLELDKSLITDAGYEIYHDETCIYAKYTDGSYGYATKFWVSVNTGLLMGSETYDGEMLIYSLFSSAPDISTPDESIFKLP